MQPEEVMAILREIRELRGVVDELVKKRARSEEEAVAHAQGLLSYEDLQDRLTIGRSNPRRPCMRRVKSLVAKYRHIVLPVKVGGCSVGFREASVERLIAYLAGEGGR